jgi:hypothetical protein
MLYIYIYIYIYVFSRLRVKQRRMIEFSKKSGKFTALIFAWILQNHIKPCHCTTCKRESIVGEVQ